MSSLAWSSKSDIHSTPSANHAIGDVEFTALRCSHATNRVRISYTAGGDESREKGEAGALVSPWRGMFVRLSVQRGETDWKLSYAGGSVDESEYGSYQTASESTISTTEAHLSTLATRETQGMLSRVQRHLVCGPLSSPRHVTEPSHISTDMQDVAGSGLCLRVYTLLDSIHSDFSDSSSGTCDFMSTAMTGSSPKWKNTKLTRRMAHGSSWSRCRLADSLCRPNGSTNTSST